MILLIKKLGRKALLTKNNIHRAMININIIYKMK